MSNWQSPPSPDSMTGWVVVTTSAAIANPNIFQPVFTLTDDDDGRKRLRSLRVRFNLLLRSLRFYPSHPLAQRISSQALTLASRTVQLPGNRLHFGLIALPPALDNGVQSIAAALNLPYGQDHRVEY